MIFLLKSDKQMLPKLCKYYAIIKIIGKIPKSMQHLLLYNALSNNQRNIDFIKYFTPKPTSASAQ